MAIDADAVNVTKQQANRTCEIRFTIAEIRRAEESISDPMTRFPSLLRPDSSKRFAICLSQAALNRQPQNRRTDRLWECVVRVAKRVDFSETELAPNFQPGAKKHGGLESAVLIYLAWVSRSLNAKARF
jgi:hypothetical protein